MQSTQQEEEITVMNEIERIDASGCFADQAEYEAALNDQRLVYDGGLRKALQRKADRSKVQLQAPPKSPSISWIHQPGRFPLNADGSDPNQSTPTTPIKENK